MKQRIILLLLAACLFFNTATACLNEYFRNELPLVAGQPDLQALLSKKNESFPYWYHSDEENIELKGRKDSLMGVLQKRPADFRLQSDIAALELRTGNRAKALAMLEKLYAEHPEEYNIVVNLGTAYEVSGNNVKALELLQKAVALNPDSHFGSEWIHVNILVQKTAAKPDYARIIGLGIDNFPAWLTNRTYVFPRTADSLKLQIAYQLHERIGFIPPPDDIIGRLVIDFADIVAKTSSYNEAIPFYEYGANYSVSLQPLATARKKGLEDAKQEANGTLRGAALIWGIPLLVIAFVVAAWIKNRNKK